MDEDRLLTVPEVAERLRISDYTVRKWLREGKIQGRRLGGAGWRVLESEVQRFIREAGGKVAA